MTTPVKQPNMHKISSLEMLSLTMQVLITAIQNGEVLLKIYTKCSGININEVIRSVKPHVPKKHLQAKNFFSLSVNFEKSKNFSPFLYIIIEEFTMITENRTAHISTEFIFNSVVAYLTRA